MFLSQSLSSVAHSHVAFLLFGVTVDRRCSKGQFMYEKWNGESGWVEHQGHVFLLLTGTCAVLLWNLSEVSFLIFDRAEGHSWFQ